MWLEMDKHGHIHLLHLTWVISLFRVFRGEKIYQINWWGMDNQVIWFLSKIAHIIFGAWFLMESSESLSPLSLSLSLSLCVCVSVSQNDGMMRQGKISKQWQTENFHTFR
jgi:hypothetical protein